VFKTQQTNLKLVSLAPRLLLLLTSFAFSDYDVFPQRLGHPLPLRDGYVNVYTGRLTNDTNRELETVLSYFEEDGAVELVVVFVHSTEGLTIEEYSKAVMEGWDIGKPPQHRTGLLLLFDVSDRQYYLRWRNEIPELPTKFLVDTSANIGTSFVKHHDVNEVAVETVRAIVDRMGQTKGFSYQQFAEYAPYADRQYTSGERETTTQSRGSSGIGRALPVLVLFALIVTLILFVFVASIVVLLKIAQRVYNFGHHREFRALTACLLLLLAFLVLFLSGSALSKQVALVRSWDKRVGPIRETNAWLQKLFGPQPNRYEVDLWGHVTELHLQNVQIKSLDELSGINELGSLRVFELSGAPLEGVLDLSTFTQLQEIYLRGTKISELRGLERLSELNVLEIDGSSMGSSVQTLDLRALRSATQLERISLTSLDLRYVTGIEDAWAVKKLNLSNCTSLPLQQVAHLYSLEELKLDYSDVRKLGPLLPLANLKSLSIVGTGIENIADFEGVRPAFLDARETSLKVADVEKEIQHQMAMVYGDKAFWQKVQQEQKERSSRFRKLAYLTLIFAVLLYLPAPRTWRGYRFLVARRIGRRLLVGFLFIAWLQPGVYSELPIHFFNLDKPVLLDLFTPHTKNLWAVFAGVLWFVMIPLFDVSLESMTLGTSHWWPTIQRISRLFPALALGGPIILVVAILLVLMIQPQELPVTLIFLVPLILILLGALVLGFILYLPSQLWKQRLQDLNYLITKEADSTQIKLMVVALHYNVMGTGIKATLASLYDSLRYDIPARKSPMSHLLMAPNIGMLAGISMKAGLAKAVSGIVFFLPRKQLEQARSWELDLLRDWTTNLYQHSNVPIWIVADWIDDTAVKSAALVCNVKRVTTLLPYLSGLEKNLQADPLVIIRTPPESISDCLTANNLTLQTTLEVRSINETIEQAFTPVASLLRGVFSYASLLDRLDALLRATELSIAYFTLALAVDFEQQQSAYEGDETQQLKRSIASLNRRLSFSGWQALFIALVRRSQSKIANDLRRALSAPAIDEANLVIQLLTAIGGSTEEVPKKVKTRESSISVLRALRNVTTAHGPASARIGADLYSKTLATVLDFVSSLPWQRATIQHISPTGVSSTFRGCLPERKTIEGENPGIYLVGDGDQPRPAALDASKYFCYVDDVDSVAIYMGKDGYLEPLSGIRIPT